jgi:hypothetical protein
VTVRHPSRRCQGCFCRLIALPPIQRKFRIAPALTRSLANMSVRTAILLHRPWSGGRCLAATGAGPTEMDSGSVEICLITQEFLYALRMLDVRGASAYDLFSGFVRVQ